MRNSTIVIIDDEKQILKSLKFLFRSEGFRNIQCFENGKDACDHIAHNSVDIVITDLIMPHMTGEEILKHCCENHPDVPVIVVTGVNEIEKAVNCIQSGASDYIVKPVEKERLIHSVNTCLKIKQLKHENQDLKKKFLAEKIEDPRHFSHIITQNDHMIQLFKYIELFSVSSEPVLITGETGVGKELFAEAVHRCSGRCGEFVPLNTAGLDETVFSDTLFGHEKGAFTGADKRREGLIEKASHGTLFLDEIGDLSLSLQVKLLRLIQQHEYYPVGSDTPKKSNARIVAATNRTVEQLQNASDFRDDLFFRLSVHSLKILPLRERKNDIPLLFNFFFEQARNSLNTTIEPVAAKTLKMLSLYDFPGNIRELRALAYDRAVKNSDDIILEKLHNTEAETSHIHTEKIIFPDELPTLRETEKQLIEQALLKCSGNQSAAASLIGITRQTLNKKIKTL